MIKLEYGDLSGMKSELQGFRNRVTIVQLRIAMAPMAPRRTNQNPVSQSITMAKLLHFVFLFTFVSGQIQRDQSFDPRDFENDRWMPGFHFVPYPQNW